MEAGLRQYITQYRQDHCLATVWDEDLSHMLGQALWTCEQQKIFGRNAMEPFHQGFQDGIKRSIPEGHTFKGFPSHFNHAHTNRAFATMMRTRACKDIVLTTGDKEKMNRSQRVESAPGCKVFVGNLSWSTNSATLRDAFGRCGDVVDAVVLTDRETGRSRGFGFVTFADAEMAGAAIQTLDNQDLDGRPIRVNLANDRPGF